MMEEGVDVEAFYVCEKFTLICESRSTVPRGPPRLTYVMGLARFKCFQLSARFKCKFYTKLILGSLHSQLHVGRFTTSSGEEIHKIL